MDVGWGEDGAMAGAHRTWYHSLNRGTRKKEGLADLSLAICEIGSGTPASVVERADVKVLCALKLICQHSLLLLPHAWPCLLLDTCLLSPLSPSWLPLGAPCPLESSFSVISSWS